MTGGLIQLITTGIQDTPLIGEPEITLFKSLYYRHSLFSLCQNEKFLGDKSVNSTGSKIIENYGDLLYNLNFKIEIPDFEIKKTKHIINKLIHPLNINEISIDIDNNKSYLFYFKNTYYIVSNKLLNIINLQSTDNLIDSSLVQPYLLPNIITNIDLGYSINILNNNLQSSLQNNLQSNLQSNNLLSILQKNSNYWEQLWFEYLKNNKDIDIQSSILSLVYQYNKSFNEFKNKLYNSYYLFNIGYNYPNYFNFQNNNYTEIERYLDYTNNQIINTNTFDIDYTYNYCTNNSLNFNDYIDNVKASSLYILLLLSLLYPSDDIIFTFWNKFNADNIVINNDYNQITEWDNNLNIYLNKINKSINIKHIIYDTFKYNYNNAQQNIANIMSNLSYIDNQTIYIKLKTILGRYYKLQSSTSNYNLNYNDYINIINYNYVLDSNLLIDLDTNNTDSNYLQLPSFIQNINLYNNNFTYLLKNETTNYSNLNRNFINLDTTNEMNNLTPVDLINIYMIIAQETVTNIINLLNFNPPMINFIIFWLNTLNGRLYKKFLDFYTKLSENGRLFDNSNNRNMTLYYSITGANMFLFNEFKSSLYEMFYKNSFLGTFSISNIYQYNFITNLYEISNLQSNLQSSNLQSNNTFQKLSIRNKYYYNYLKSVDPDYIDLVFFSNNNMYIKYENYYDSNQNIILYINDIKTTYSSIIQKLYNNILYLVFSNVKQPAVNSVICLDVIYTTHVPIVLFTNDNLIYNNIDINKFYLLTKDNYNNIKINNILQNNSIYYNTSINNNNIKVLTIEYLFDNNISPPNGFTLSPIVALDDTNKYIGYYSYLIVYNLNNNDNSIASEKVTGVFNLFDAIIIDNIPTLPDKNIIGRTIYRTKFNESTFYKLVTINDNTTTIFIDNITDDLLVEKLSSIKQNYNNVTKQIINIISDTNNNYFIHDLSGNTVLLPTDYSNINSIYIETINTEYKFLDVLSGYTLPGYKNDTIYLLNNNSDYKEDCNYYLVNPENLQDNIELILSKEYILFKNKIKLTEKQSNNNSNQQYTVNYIITLYSNNGIESFESDIVSITVDSNSTIDISDFPPFNDNYDVINIYRQIEDIDTDFLKLTSINPKTTLIFNDDISIELTTPYNKYDPSLFYFYPASQPNNTINIEFSLTNLNIPGNIYGNNDISNPIKYYYLVQYYNSITKKYSLYSTQPDNMTTNYITVAYSTQILIIINNLDKNYDTIHIYRATYDTDYKLLTTLYNNNNSETINYTDNIADVSDGIIFNIMNSDTKYKILQIPKSGLVPNLNEFLASSSDYRYMNNKKLSDMNDYIYNKPMILLSNRSTNTHFVNNSLVNNTSLKNSLDSSYLYFMNINFKINKTSEILLNDIQVNYLLPLSTDLFFMNNLPSQPTFYLESDNSENFTTTYYYKIRFINNISQMKTVLSKYQKINILQSNNLQTNINIIFIPEYYKNIDNYNKIEIYRSTDENTYYYIDNVDIDTINYTDNLLQSNIILNNNNGIPFAEEYYSIDLSNNSIYKENTNNINESFSPSYNNFNLSIQNIFNNTKYVNSSANYSSFALYINIVDSIAVELDNIINNNIDYYNITNAISNIENEYYKMFNLNNVYGTTSQYIIDKIDKINTISIQDLSKFNNNDFFNSSHYAFNLTPIYNSYNASNKISTNLTTYLKDIYSFFTNQLEYINNNIDYLNKTNINNYDEKYIGFNEIIQEQKNQFYDNVSNSTISLVYPITSSNNIDSIIYNDKSYSASIVNNNIISNLELSLLPTNYKDTNIYNNSQIANNLQVTNVFKYLGLVNINNNNEINHNEFFNSQQDVKYIMTDNNNIYETVFDNIENKYKILQNDGMNIIIMNPNIVSLNNNSNNNTLTSIKTRYYYLIQLEFEHELNLFSNNYRYQDKEIIITINGYIINAFYTYNCNGINENFIYFISDNKINVNFTSIIFKANTVSNYINEIGNNSKFLTSPKVTSINIIKFRELNYSINLTLSNITLNEGDVLSYSINGVIYYISYNDIIIIKESNNLYAYVYINNSNNDLNINIYSQQNNQIVYNKQPSIIIKNGYIYYYNELFNIINTITNDKYVLMIDSDKQQYILLVNEIKNKKIPPNNYYLYYSQNNNLPLIQIDYNINITTDNSGNVYFSNLPNIPTYSYYYMHDTSGNTAIYYYETGMNIIRKNYYTTDYFLKNSIITKLYLIDNNIFDNNHHQYLKIKSNTVSMTENIITKELVINNLNFTLFKNTENLEYKSNYITNLENSYISVNHLNNNLQGSIIQLDGEKEEIVELFINNNNTIIYQPLIIRKQEDNIIPNVRFTFNNIVYNKSCVIIDSRNINYNENNDIIVGSIISNLQLTSLSQNLILEKNNQQYNIIISKNFTINNSFGIYLWKILCNNSFIMYFWTIFTDNDIYINSYLNIGNNISEPYYYSNDGISNYFNSDQNNVLSLISSSPNIIEQQNKNLIFKNNNFDSYIHYKYYTDTRFGDYSTSFNYFDYEIKLLNYNGITNIKPQIYYYGTINILQNSNNLQINNFDKNIVYFIIEYYINNVVKYDFIYNNTIDFSKYTDIITIYYSLEFPLFIYNNISIIISNDKYYINKYDYLYLEKNDIIMIDNNYFLVIGLMINGDKYELKLLNTPTKLNATYKGYYSLGNYLKTNNKILQNNQLPYNNIITYNYNLDRYYIEYGDMTIDSSNNQLKIITNKYSIIKTTLFSENLLIVKLYFDEKQPLNTLYMFDQFINIKITDKILYANYNTVNVYEVINIRDNIIYLDSNLDIYNSGMYSFILPYQPFNVYYVNIIDDNIYSDKIKDNMILLLNNTYTEMDMCLIKNNKINYTSKSKRLPNGYRYVRVLASNYTSNFNLPYVVPNRSIESKIDNIPIEILTIYSNNKFKIVNASIVQYYNFYFMMPIKILGTFNYLKNIIISEDNNYYIELLNNINVKSEYVTMICSPYTNYEYYTSNIFQYNNALQPIDYDNINTAYGSRNLDVVKYYLYNDDLVFIDNYKKQIKIEYMASSPDKPLKDSKYSYLYFYNNSNILFDIPSLEESAPMFIENFNILYDSYHLLLEKRATGNFIHLCRIVYPNKLKIYTNIQYDSDFYLSKIFPIHINQNNEFNVLPMTVVVNKSLNTITNNENQIYLLYKYNIKFDGSFYVNNNIFYQNIIFIDNIDILLYDKVEYDIYISKSDLQNNNYKLKYLNNKFVIISSKYISNDITTIYIKKQNIIKSSTQTSNRRAINIDDTRLEDIIGNIDNKEYYNFELLLKNENNNLQLAYNYTLKNNTNDLKLSLFSKYYIDNINNNTKYIETQKIITTYPIYGLDYSNINIYLENTANTLLFLNSNNNNGDIKELRIKLFNNMIIDTRILQSLKPWDTWSILNISTVLDSIKNVLNHCYLKWEGTVVKYTDNNVNNYSYLTNNEVEILSDFLISVNNNIELYNKLQNIFTSILNILPNWLSVNSFFLDVNTIINDYLINNFDNFTYNGDNLYYNNIIIDNNLYLSNEYTYDISNNIVYRSTNNYNKINDEINDFFNNQNKSLFGFNLIQLLNHLTNLGVLLKEGINNMTITDTIYYNSLQSNLQSNHLLNFMTANIYNKYKKSLNNISVIFEENKFITKYDYSIQFNDTLISTNNKYYIDFLNGINIDIIVPLNQSDVVLYPDKLLFKTDINIQSTDYLMVKEEKIFNITALKCLGYNYILTFDNINLSYIDNIYYRTSLVTINDNLKIKNSVIDKISVLIVQSNRLTINDTFELRMNVSISSLQSNSLQSNLQSKNYITFYNNNINFIANKTFLKSKDIYYLLCKDNDGYYINNLDATVQSEIINDNDLSLILNINPSSIEYTDQVVYSLSLDNNIYDNYNPTNNYINPLNFRLIDTTNNSTIVPINIFSLSINEMNPSNNINLYFDYIDSLYINNSLESSLENNIIYIIPNDGLPITTNMVIYVYDTTLNEIIDNKPSIDIENKTSTSINILQSSNLQNNNSYIYVTNNYIPTNINNISYIIKNSWNIVNFTMNYMTYILTFNLPTDFTYNIDCNYYVNSLLINKNSININTNTVTIQLTFLTKKILLSDIIIFEQYYNSQNIIPLTYVDLTKKYNYNQLKYFKKLGEIITNEVVSIEKQEEYLYNIDKIIPSCENTVIYIYANNNLQNNKSIYFKQNNNITQFTLSINVDDIDLLNNIRFIQENSFNVTGNIIDNIIYIPIPNNLIIINNSNYYYSFNDIIIDNNDIIINKGNIIFNWTSNINNGIFKQYYKEDNYGLIYKPTSYRKALITLKTDFQYDPSKQFLLVPYTATGNELNNYNYLIRTNIVNNTNAIGLMGGYGPNNDFYLSTINNINPNIYNGKIFDIYYDDYINYIVSFNEILDINKTYVYNLPYQNSNNVNSIEIYQNTFVLGSYYEQNNMNSIYLFIDNNTQELNYNQNINLIKPTKYYLVENNYYTLINYYNNNTIKQNENMIQKVSVSSNIIETKEKININNPIRFFEYIKLFIGDQLIEQLNTDVYNIYYYLYLTEEKRKAFDNMTKIRYNEKNLSYEIYLPLIFWFCNNSAQSIPLIALQQTPIRLEYKLNGMDKIITNDLVDMTYPNMIYPNIKLTLISDFILLDKMERKLFGSHSHEYILDIYNIDSNYIITNNSTKKKSIIPRRYSGLVKDIHLITKMLDDFNKTAFEKVETEYDYRYDRYNIAYNYYKTYIQSYIFSDSTMKEYSNDINIIMNNMNLLNIYISSVDKTESKFDQINMLINNFGKYKYFDSNYEFLLFLMYYVNYFIPNLSISRQIYVLNMYLQYQFNNNKNIIKISPIGTITLRANGVPLFENLDNVYFNSLVPYNKYKASIPEGYYSYTFSLYPTSNQHSGHLNFNNFDDVVYEITNNDLQNSLQSSSNISENYIISTVTKQYNILRIMSGIGSLGWIN
jgi:hypothetical protein